MRTFLLKCKHFFRRNIYPITVSVCTVLILGIVTISAYNSIKNSDSETVTQTMQEIREEPVLNTDVMPKNEPTEIVTPINASEPIIFDLPFANATVLKQYTDSSLLYDKTTKLWCTHQGLDFACEEGKQVLAVYDGKIQKIESTMMYGTVVYLKINDELTVVYKGLSSNISVKEGDNIKKGAIIGTVTSFLAEKSDGVHLHLELLQNNKLVDPTEYFSFNK